MSGQLVLQMRLDLGPFAREYAVDNGVANRAVATQRVMTDDAVTFRAESFYRILRRMIEIVGAKTDHLASQGFKCVRQQDQLATGIHMGALHGFRVPGVADLDAIDTDHDVVITRGPDYFSA